MSIKPGDKIVCIQNDDYDGALTIGKTYEFTIPKSGVYPHLDRVHIRPDDVDDFFINPMITRFISLEEFRISQRKEKLENINNLLPNEF